MPHRPTTGETACIAAGLVVAFAVLAVADWLVIVGSSRHRRALTKTAATVVLVAIAATAGEMAGDARVALVIAVLACLAGDIALLGDDDAHFLAGLGAFAAGHVAYVVTALLVGVSWPRLAWAFPFLVVVLAVQASSRMIPLAAARAGAAMAVAVAAYSLIISAMVVAATGTGSWLAAAGAMLFAVSDTLIGYSRFVRPVRRADLAIMVTYHVGQLLLILGLVVAG